MDGIRDNKAEPHQDTRKSQPMRPCTTDNATICFGRLFRRHVDRGQLGTTTSLTNQSLPLATNHRPYAFGQSKTSAIDQSTTLPTNPAMTPLTNQWTASPLNHLAIRVTNHPLITQSMPSPTNQSTTFLTHQSMTSINHRRQPRKFSINP